MYAWTQAPTALTSLHTVVFQSILIKGVWNLSKARLIWHPDASQHKTCRVWRALTPLRSNTQINQHFVSINFHGNLFETCCGSDHKDTVSPSVEWLIIWYVTRDIVCQMSILKSSPKYSVRWECHMCVCLVQRGTKTRVKVKENDPKKATLFGLFSQQLHNTSCQLW